MSLLTPAQVKDLIENPRPCKKIIATELSGKEFDSVLEVGCQFGESLKAISDTFPDKKLVGIDIDKFEIDTVQEFIPKIKLIWGNAKKLPFENESFDVVFTNALFCMVHPDDVEPILNEIIRVAKKYIYLVELNTIPLIEVLDKDRTGANWEMLFKAKGLKAQIRKITTEEWDALPWRYWGYLISAEK